MSATASEVFIPERSRMYFFSFETTISISSWSYSFDSAGPPACAVTEPAGAGGRGLSAGAATTVCARGGLAVIGAGAGADRAAGGSSSACSPRFGATSSTTHASRWRMVERWESQQATEQNTRRVRFRLQVETLHTQ